MELYTAGKQRFPQPIIGTPPYPGPPPPTPPSPFLPNGIPIGNAQPPPVPGLTPARTGQESPDTLPLQGYTRDQLTQYIYRQLGSPVWDIEVTRQQIYDAVQDALGLYSLSVPRIRMGAVRLLHGVHKYLQGEDVGQGVAKVEFLEPNPVPSQLYWSNLISPAPLFRFGLDEYDSFLRWRKTWERVTSVSPDATYDEFEKCLLLSNPIGRYHCAVTAYFNWEDTKTMDVVGSNWVKEYSLECARYVYGEDLAKYGGAIPGPGKDLQLDQSKRDRAEKRIDALKTKLQSMARNASISVD